MDGPLKSSEYSVRHAKRNIDVLEGHIANFLASQPYAEVTEVESNGTEDVHKIKLVKAMPEELSGTAFDVVNSLRSALDQAAHAIGVAAGTKGKKSHFPFGDSLANVQSLKGRGSKDLPQAIFDFMVAFKPYKGGNDTLWAVNALANSHKHEIILPVATCAGAMKIERSFLSAASEFCFPPRWDPKKNELILSRVPHGAKTEMNGTVTVFITIGQTDVLRIQPAGTFLRKAAGEVEGIVAALEAEARRLGIFK